MVLLACRSAGELLRSTSRRSRWGLECVALTPVFLAIALLFGRFYTHVDSLPQPPRGYTIALLLLIIGETMALTILIGARKRKAALLSSVLAAVLLVSAIERYELPWLDAYQSPRTAARLVLATGPAPQKIFTAQMDRNWQYALNFYFHRELPEWTPGSPAPSYVFVSSAGLEALDEQGIKYEFLGPVTTRRNLVKTAAAGGVSGPAIPEWKK